jgi:iron complex transport system ATP-binding protein
MTSLLDARSLCVDGRLESVDVEVRAGECVGLIGPNGSGKTTLLRALAGIEGDGDVRIDGSEVHATPPAKRMRMLAFLPASRDLTWPIRVRDVIALGLPTPDSARIDELLQMLELAPLADRPANQLSTGERSRVLLARALAPRPRLLLLDEPLSNLDPYWVLRTLDLLRTIVAEEQCAAVLSLHDLNQVERLDRVLLLDSGEVSRDAAPAQMLASADLARTFRIERKGSGWRVRPPEDRRSLP